MKAPTITEPLADLMARAAWHMAALAMIANPARVRTLPAFLERAWGIARAAYWEACADIMEQWAQLCSLDAYDDDPLDDSDGTDTTTITINGSLGQPVDCAGGAYDLLCQRMGVDSLHEVAERIEAANAIGRQVRFFSAAMDEEWQQVDEPELRQAIFDERRSLDGPPADLSDVPICYDCSTRHRNPDDCPALPDCADDCGSHGNRTDRGCDDCDMIEDEGDSPADCDGQPIGDSVTFEAVTRTKPTIDSTPEHDPEDDSYPVECPHCRAEICMTLQEAEDLSATDCPNCGRPLSGRGMS